jgi:hypothetical protein
MQFYVVEPEVAGGWGDNIIVDRSVEPVRVEHLHYQFEGWLGDELLTTHPVYICTERVAAALQAGGFSGFGFSEVEVSRSSQFEELHPGRRLRPFRWLKVTGEAERDDFGLRGGHLVVSERALSCLRAFSLIHARIRTVGEFEWDPEKHTDQLFAEAKAWADEMRRQREVKKK